MGTEFPFIEIPDHLKKIIGEPDAGTRLYRVYGSQEDVKPWFDAVLEICHEGGGSVSPGGVSMYASVSRPAVHKRMKEGRLTAFLFHVTKDGVFFKDKKRLDQGGRPYAYIPASECKAWAIEMQNKPSRKVKNEKTDWNGDFLNAPKDWKKKDKD